MQPQALASQPSTAALDPHAGQIVLAHGGGGQLTDELFAEVLHPRLANQWLDPLDDSAVIPLGDQRIVFSTDSYVVHPLEFPGGDIGRLTVSGTVNDLAVCGAETCFLSLGLILEEGLEMDLLRRVMDSIARTAREAGAPVVTGDTKVVSRGQADGLYINTAGVGRRMEGVALDQGRIREGDVVLISGTIAEHGLAVMLQREQSDVLESTLRSDAAPLNGLIGALLRAVPEDVVFLRDPTRGGLAGVVSDLAVRAGRRLMLDEPSIPIRQETRYAAEMLGLDPLDVACEGRVVVVTRPDAADAALRSMRAHAYGKGAAIIGHFGAEEDGLCELITDVGGRRIVQKPYGEELPRIC